MSCPAGSNGKGGKCDCTAASGWEEGEWLDPWCHEGKCYSGQDDYPGCIGKGLNSIAEDLGDGTWCFNERRDTDCLIVPGSLY